MKKILLFLLLIGAASGLMAQNWELDPSFGDIELSMGFDPDPYVFDLIAGGDIDLTESELAYEAFGYGFVSDPPDIDFYYDGDGSFDLSFLVFGWGADIILLINGPDGEWYFDDDGAGDLDPMITFPNAEEGLYSIWVGSFEPEDYVDVTLNITETL